MITANGTNIMIKDYQDELVSIVKGIRYCEQAINGSDENWEKKEYQGALEDRKARMDQIIAIFKRINQPLVITFQDGDYTIRPDQSGDTICGAAAHAAMFRMDRTNSYKQREFEYRVKFILEKSVV